MIGEREHFRGQFTPGLVGALEGGAHLLIIDNVYQRFKSARTSRAILVRSTSSLVV
jgi:hypothetical protein